MTGKAVATAEISAGNSPFPRSARLLTAADYSQVFQKNRRYTDHYWTVLVHQAPGSAGRLGLAIAKKRAKRAIDRNKLKRVAREAFRHHREQLESHQLVVMNRDAAGSADKETLRRSLNALLGKVVKGSQRT